MAPGPAHRRRRTLGRTTPATRRTATASANLQRRPSDEARSREGRGLVVPDCPVRLTRQSSFILNLIVNDPDTGDRPRATYVRSTLGVRGRWQRSNEVLPCEAPSEALAFHGRVGRPVERRDLRET